jgi:nucleotide-binding universal stress UspA family protein
MTTAQATKRITLNNILFLTDFSEPSGSALPFASAIGRTYGSVVHALHVLQPSAYTYMSPEVATTLLDDEEDRARGEMQRIEAELTGLPRETIIERGGAVWPVLSRVLKEHEIDLIVLGTHGRTGLQKVLLGSSAEEVFRRARVPVLTIGPAVKGGAHWGGRFRCVLFATDFNAVSTVAGAYAVSLAQENQARLILLHILSKPPRTKTGRSGQLSIAEAMHQLHELVPPEAELWCRPEAMVQHGDPAEQILVTANECGADLIVLGVRGLDALTGVATHLNRAIAYDVVAHAPCPVFTVRDQESLHALSASPKGQGSAGRNQSVRR